MQLYSTNNPNLRVSFQEAIFKGLPDDKGLYMPLEIQMLPKDFVYGLSARSFQEISFIVAKGLLQGAMPDIDLERIIQKSINFPAPVIRLDDKTYVLELFHGPSLAFKDFGARFMSQVMSYFNRGEDKKLTILVATSGDTGGAVAAGFFQTPGIEVVILYPSGKVSSLQEKQLTTLGHNVVALEVDGTFDDCQNLVKRAFLDPDIIRQMRLSSANSINISRLIPQTFYYFEAYKQIEKRIGLVTNVVFSVPSGNFGNLTAGILAKRMGLPVHQFIAATNTNDVVPEYLEKGIYAPQVSKRTLSNAMDVGDPSNFARMLGLYCSTWNNMTRDITGYGFSDDATRGSMREIDSKYGYTMDPHGAVGYLALRKYQKKQPFSGIILETAHPAKFVEDVEKILERRITIPDSFVVLAKKEKKSVKMTKKYEDFKEWLLHH